MDIEGFSGQYSFLSNFYYSDFVWGGKTWRTSEHAFQAAKALHEEDRERVRNCASPGQAKRMGRQIEIRSDWEKVRIKYMTDIVFEKFSQNLDLAEELIKIDGYIEETNNWGDTFWGVSKGKGKNELGLILMQVRHSLRNLF